MGFVHDFIHMTRVEFIIAYWPLYVVLLGVCVVIVLILRWKDRHDHQ